MAGAVLGGAALAFGADPTSTGLMEERAMLVSQFSGPAEPQVEKALWSSDRVFNIGIHDMGMAEHNRARGACAQLQQLGFGAGYRVRVIDINSMGDREQEWEIIGEASCGGPGQPD